MKTLIATLVGLLFSGSSSQSAACGCFRGIGSSNDDKPSLTLEVGNETTLSVCGFERKKYNENEILISEFNVFNCQTGEVLVEYGALQTCRVAKSEKVLQISELKLLPAGKNWKWIQVIIGFQQILVKDENVVVQTQKPAFEKAVTNKTEVDSFMQELHKLKGTGKLENPEEILGRLEFLALNGIQKAEYILFDFEKYFNFLTDGAVAEQWNDAVATVKWINE